MGKKVRGGGGPHQASVFAVVSPGKKPGKLGKEQPRDVEKAKKRVRQKQKVEGRSLLNLLQGWPEVAGEGWSLRWGLPEKTSAKNDMGEKERKRAWQRRDQGIHPSRAEVTNHGKRTMRYLQKKS